MCFLLLNFRFKLIKCFVFIACIVRWMDGTSLGLQKWDENQPNPDTIDSNCVTMNYYMGE